MAELTVQEMDRNGLTPSYDSADAGGDTFTWARYAFLHVKNDDDASHDVTIAEQHDSAPAGYEEADLVVSVPAGEERMIGPLDRQAYQNDDGDVEVSYDDVTSVTVAAIKLADN